MSAGPPTGPVVELRQVSKSFGATRALADVSLSLLSGEVHVLAGENGAGKSTLIKILCGVHTDFTGELLVAGAPVRFRGPADAAHAGIVAIHQELSLVGSLSVADNLYLATPGNAFSLTHAKQRAGSVHQSLELVGLDVDPNRTVSSLSLAQRQLVEIARALTRQARVVVMDEPTSALSEPEVEVLFGLIDRLRASGTAIVYISHRLEEMYRVSDRITVLRDGEVVTAARTRDLEQRRLVAAMVGRELTAPAPAPSQARMRAALEVRGLTLWDPVRRRTMLDDVSFSARQGEILGLAGLQGSGCSLLLHALFGTHGAPRSKSVRLAEARHDVVSPKRSIQHGVVLLSNDRQHSMLQAMSVLHNSSLSSLLGLCQWGWVDRARERIAVQQTSGQVRLGAPSLAAEVRQLSGGNQQKVALTRCLLARPQLLLLDEPTRGIDVGAKADIYALIRELAGEGMTILLVASELEELLALSDRILVMSEGRIVAELLQDEFSRERVLRAALGTSGASA